MLIKQLQEVPKIFFRQVRRELSLDLYTSQQHKINHAILPIAEFKLGKLRCEYCTHTWSREQLQILSTSVLLH